MGHDTESYKRYETVRNESISIIMSATSAYDRTLISLSTILIGFIITYSAQFKVHIDSCSIYLVASTIFFCMTAFWLDQYGACRAIKFAEEYYINDNEEYKDKVPWQTWLSNILKILAGALYILGVIIFYKSTLKTM